MVSNGVEQTSQPVTLTVAGTAGAHQEGLAVVGELELSPAAEDRVRVDVAAAVDQVERSERGAIVVAAVVQEHRPARRRRDREDIARRVVGGHGGRVQ